MALIPRALREVLKEIQRLNNIPQLPTAELTADDAFFLNKILNLPHITPLVEAQLYKYYEDHGLTHGRIAAIFGQHRTHVTNMINLLELPIELLEALSDPDSGVKAGHAKALKGLKHRRPLVIKLLKQIIDEKKSVRWTEYQVKQLKNSPFVKEPHRFDELIAQAVSQAQLGAGIQIAQTGPLTIEITATDKRALLSLLSTMTSHGK